MREPRAIPPPDISPVEFFTRWVPARVAEDVERARRLGGTRAVLQFELTGEGGGLFTLELEDGAVSGHPGGIDDADLRVTLAVETWRELNSGELSAPMAFVQRKVHLHGNLLLAVKLHLILG
jgi:putative sterol carrier protein